MKLKDLIEAVEAKTGEKIICVTGHVHLMPSEELITMLTSYVQDNRRDYAIEVFRLCKAEIDGELPHNLQAVSCEPMESGCSFRVQDSCTFRGHYCSNESCDIRGTYDK